MAPSPLIPQREIIDATDCRRLGAKTRGVKDIPRSTLLYWRKHLEFPKPFKKTRGGTELWDRREVVKWLEKYQETMRVEEF